MHTTPVHHPFRVLLVVVAVAAVTTACGDDTGATPETADVLGTTMSRTETAMDDGEETFGFGEPADESEADRSIRIEARDELAFDPETIEVAVGEVVTFEVHNPGVAQHDFTLGDRHAQEEHEAEMQEMMEEGASMHAEPNAITVPPGETKRLTWRFTEPGELLYGCHEPGHYGAGMVGTITVE